MADMTALELGTALDESYDDLLDEVFDDKLIAGLERADSPESFLVTTPKLQLASKTATQALSVQTRMAAFATGGIKVAKYASSDGLGELALDVDAVTEEADEPKRKAAADAIRDLLCGKLRSWVDANIDKLKKLVEDSGIKGALKSLAKLGKQLVLAAVTGIAGVVGSMFVAWLLIAIAVAAVGAAIYYAIKHGVPNYCSV